MNRLQSEVHRLYLSDAPASADAADPAPTLIDSSGKVRALVLELTRPARWAELGKVWRGVQSGFDLPPPAIAVSGTDGLQLWFSLVEPVPVARAHAFLDGLRTHFLGEIPPARIALMPALAGSVSGERAHAPLVPALQARTGLWSAFVAPDLAAVFADTPGLDIPPGEDGQAGLLQGLESIKPGAFEAAAARLGLAQTPAVNTATSNNPTLSAAPSPPAGAVAPGLPIPAARWPTGDDPRRFLQQVMNDDSVTLALRIEAAKVLLQHAGSATD